MRGHDVGFCFGRVPHTGHVGAFTQRESETRSAVSHTGRCVLDDSGCPPHNMLTGATVMRKLWTMFQHDGPDHLGLWSNTGRAAHDHAPPLALSRQVMWKIWTTFQHDGPDHLGLRLNIVTHRRWRCRAGSRQTWSSTPGPRPRSTAAPR